MSPRPLIFISAVSRELRGARQLVANTVTFLGYDPIWQDIFETSEGDLRGVLRRQISRCNGVVQLVGCCYGAEPPQPTEEFGRVSYTQYEALYARKVGKKVWYLFLDEHFPSDACVDEPEELHALQSAYRNRLRADTHLYHPLTTLEGLEASVLKLRGDLTQLRKGAKRWAAGVAILLLIGVAVNVWLLQWQRRTSQQMTETQNAISQQSKQAVETRQAVASVGEEMAKLREGIIQYVQVEGKVREAQTETGLVRDQVYEQLGKQMNMNVALLREKLPQAAERLKDAPGASPFERASAAYVANDYREAERMALQAVTQARTATPINNADVIRALKLAGFAAQKRIEYATAMEHLREAAGLTNRERDPGRWAEIQHAIADVLIDQGQYRQAATVLQGALEARANAFGPENPDTLRSRNRLAYALWRQGRYRDAEGEFRKLVGVEERLLGAQHPETLASENGLANALDDEGKHTDAESEHRHVLEVRIKVLGLENPETLKSRNNLALALNRQKKYVEAEKQFRELITVEERVLGPKHPETLRTRRNLFVTVGNQGRHTEAETGFRALLAAQELVLGPEHPDTLGVRNNMGYALAQQGRFADAEAQFRDVIRIETKVLGPEHPATLSSRMALAGVLSEQQKFGEADAQFREVIALEEKVLGTDHPSTISSWYAFANQLARQNKTDEAIQFARRAATAAEQVFGQDHPDTRKYAQLVQQLESQQPGADQGSVKPVKAGVHEYAAAEARPKATSALLVDQTSGQPIGRETYNGSVKVEYSDGRSEIFCKDGNCADPHVSHEGHVGWTHYTHRGHRNAAMNERLVIRFSNGQTKEFKPNPNGGPFIEEWNFIDNDVAVAIKSRGHHGPASFVRYDLISGRMTGHQDGYVEYEKMPEWAQPFSDDIPFGLRASNVTQRIQAAQNEQSFNKSEVTPESIAEAFVQAYSGADVDTVAGLYADRVDYTNSGIISNTAVRAQAKEYFARWPVRQWSLAGPVQTTSMGPSRQKMIFSASYDASDPQTNRHASGIAQETLILASDKSGAIKIVSHKEQTSKRSSGQSGESGIKTSDANFETATADSASDAAMKQKLLGYWHSGRHAYLFKSDGICYMVEGTTTSHWDIRGGVYYDDGIPCKIVSLNEKEFEFRSLDNASHYLEDRWERCSKKEIEQLKKCCSDWMKEHE